MSNRELTNCCKAPVSRVYSADEGTCYMCIKCYKTCDLHIEPVGVQFGIGISNEVEEVTLPINEYNRLKRLDENIQKRIAGYERGINGAFGSSFLEKILLLESLYDE